LYRVLLKIQGCVVEIANLLYQMATELHMAMKQLMDGGGIIIKRKLALIHC